MPNTNRGSIEPNIIKQRIDSGGFSLGQIAVVFICFVLNMLDGFDIVAMSAVAPVLSNEWGISSEEKGFILSAALLGMTIGAMFLAPLCDKYGRRYTMLVAAAATGGCMLLTGLLPQSVPLMILLRAMTGLGVGVILASTASITTEFAPERWRNFCVPLVILGYPFGAMSAGPIAELLVPHYGWQGVFYAGGLFSLCVAAVMLVLLPESIAYLGALRGRNASRLARINEILVRFNREPIDALPAPQDGVTSVGVRALLTPDFRINSLKLWIISFVSLLNMYFLLSWLPSLFVNSGLARSDGNAALTLFNLGAIIGILTLGLLTSRIPLVKPITWFFGLSSATMFYFAWLGSSDVRLLNAMLFVIGFLFQGAYTGMYTVASRAYPAAIRATGVGWAIGLGRVGAILAPLVVGYLVAAGWTMYELFVLFAIPVILAAALVSTIKLSSNT